MDSAIYFNRNHKNAHFSFHFSEEPQRKRAQNYKKKGLCGTLSSTELVADTHCSENREHIERNGLEIIHENIVQSPV